MVERNRTKDTCCHNSSRHDAPDEAHLKGFLLFLIYMPIEMGRALPLYAGLNPRPHEHKEAYVLLDLRKSA